MQYLMYPQFGVLADRKNSYVTWPRDAVVEPIALATAGFFYSGSEDSCICFYCGINLKHWNILHDPWVQHTIGNPACIFVLLHKGLHFTEKIVNSRQDLDVDNCDLVEINKYYNY